MRFKDRLDAGNQLADKLHVKNPQNTVVFALPRGGVPLGLIVADKFDCPLDVLLAKKIVHPQFSEFAIGALAEKGELLLNPEVQVEQDWINQETERVNKENQRRRNLYSKYIDKQAINGKDVIIVDDGIATGMTMFAAINGVQAEEPNSVTVAVPIIPKDTYQRLMDVANTVSYVEVPEYFLGAVGAYYQSFPQISDDEIIKMLQDRKNSS